MNHLLNIEPWFDCGQVTWLNHGLIIVKRHGLIVVRSWSSDMVEPCLNHVSNQIYQQIAIPVKIHICIFKYSYGIP